MFVLARKATVRHDGPDGPDCRMIVPPGGTAVRIERVRVTETSSSWAEFAPD